MSDYIRGAERKYRELDDFREWLTSEGYTERTILGYVRGAWRFLQLNRPINKEEVVKWRNEMAEASIKGKDDRRDASGAMKYYQFMSGERKARMNHKSRARKCNRDCFNCIYSDCIMP